MSRIICIQCNQLIEGEKVGIYFANESLDSLQLALARNFNVDEGDICYGCLNEIKANDEYIFPYLLSRFNSECP